MSQRWAGCSPRDAALTVLRARFGAAPTALTGTTDHVDGLASFQADGVARVQRLLDRRGGAILADSVGLGKTHIARAVIRDVVRGGGHVLVCGPAALRSHWRRHLRSVQSWEWLSHTSLSRGAAPRAQPSLIVVDEAHAFRNPATRRYRRFASIRGNARVLLLTATPVNNSVMDFYHLLRLFCAHHEFADVGVTDLLTAMETVGVDAGPLRRVVEAIVIRRTRELVERYWSVDAATAAAADRTTALAALAAAPARLRFPRRDQVRLLRYDLSLAYPGLMTMLASALLALRFPAHTCPAATGGIAELMRLGLLKRLESSQAAFAASLREYARLLTHFIAAARQSLWLDVRRDLSLHGTVDGAVQLALDRLALAPWPATLDRHSMLTDAIIELVIVAGLLDAVGGADRPDPKLELLVARLDSELREEQVLIFTEFRETARMIWRQLADRGGVALVHGGEARLGRAVASRGAVIRRFAPQSNGLPPPRQHERVRVLIATDVLAEGLNLQDARVVISYDVPWNPVRMAQRFGRIDRLGSPHDTVIAYAFRPDRHVDTLLGLMRRVRRKLRDIRTVGGDAPSLGGGPRSLRVDRRSVSADPGLPGRLPGSSGEWGSAERLRLEYVASIGTDARRRVVASRRGIPAAVLSGVELSAAPMEHDPVARAALVVIGCGDAVYNVVVRRDAASRGRIRIEIDGSDADSLLMTALGSADNTAAPDVDWLDCVARLAMQALRRRVATASTGSGATGREPAVRQAARIVRRWLSGRAGGATPGEAAVADELLAALRQTDAATSFRLGEFVRAGLADDEFIGRLGTLFEDHPARLPSNRRPTRPRTIAVIDFRAAPRVP